VKSAEKGTGLLYVGDRPASKYSLPFAIINGFEDGPIITIISGQHGTEYVGIATAIEVIRKIDPKKLAGVIIVVPVVNPLGFEQRTRLAFPLDDDFDGTRNLNRLWPGDSKGSLAHLSIHAVFAQVVKKSQYLLDLHGGDIYEFLCPCTMITKVGKEKVDEESRMLAEIIGYDYIVEAEVSSLDRGRSKTEASLIGIPAVIVETGDQGKYDGKLVDKAFTGISNVLKYLKMVEGKVEPKKNYKIVHEMVKIKAKIGGLFVQSVSVGNVVKKGDKLGQVISIDGSLVEDVMATESGLLIESFCNPAVNTGETLAEIAIFE